MFVFVDNDKLTAVEIVRMCVISKTTTTIKTYLYAIIYCII